MVLLTGDIRLLNSANSVLTRRKAWTFVLKYVLWLNYEWTSWTECFARPFRLQSAWNEVLHKRDCGNNFFLSTEILFDWNNLFLIAEILCDDERKTFAKFFILCDDERKTPHGWDASRISFLSATNSSTSMTKQQSAQINKSKCWNWFGVVTSLINF